MITIHLNGRDTAIAQPSPTLLLALELAGVDPERRGLALCLNLQVIHRQDWPRTSLHEGDRVDIVIAAPGG